MVNRGRFSADDIKQIGLRMKSARVLTGLNQEEFSNKHSLVYMSLKSWEMGRAMPRREGMLGFLEAIRKDGIQVNSEWVYYGSGAGPTYLTGTQIEERKTESTHLELQIELFKKEQLSRGFNPIIVKMSDCLMAPQFKLGDLIGGVFTTISDIRSKWPIENIKDVPWLVSLNDGNFAPRYLFFSGDRWFFKSNQDPELYDCAAMSIGHICWHYSGFEQT